MINKNDIITLDDNNDYVVFNTFQMDGLNYAYLVNIKNPENVLCTKFNNGEFDIIQDEEELKRFLAKVNESI